MCRRRTRAAFTSEVGADLNTPTEETVVALPVEPAPQGRRDTRDRLLLGAGALFAFLAMGASMVALNREVPFLDIHIERASIQHSPTTTSTLLSTTTASIAPVASTTTSSVVVATTEAPTTTVMETTTIPPSTVPATVVPVTTTAPEPVVANTVPQTEPEDDPTEVTIVYQAPTTTEAPPVTTPASTTVPTPGGPPPTTAPIPTTTVPAGPQLMVSLPCAPNASGVTFTITTRADGTVRRVRLSNLPNACTDVKVRITLKNAAGAELGSDAAKVRSSHWVETSYSGFQANLVTQIVATVD